MVRAAKSKIGKKEKNDRLYKAILTLETEEEAWEFCASLFPDRTGDRLENSCVPRELLPPFWP